MSDTVGARPGGRLSARISGWPLGGIIGAGLAVAAVVSIAAIVVGALALGELTSARESLVGDIDPAAFHASQLQVALLNQETGLRGYALAANPAFLQPYTLGQRQQRQQVPALRKLLAGMPLESRALDAALAKVTAWRATYAGPVIAAVRATGHPGLSTATDLQGKADFDSIRVSFDTLQGDLSTRRAAAARRLSSAALVVDEACVGIAVALIGVVAAFAFGLWRSAIRPMSELAGDAMQVAEGDFGHEVAAAGPREARAVGAAVNSMRERILSELTAVQTAHTELQARTADLQRSNSELEQFAYVASHDLQEPLRKVASFCQLLQRRYANRLDAKADEYIDLAVDGAKRMQALINDLLAFSRVGRQAGRREIVSTAVLLEQAWANLAPEVKSARATLDSGELPELRAEATLLTTAFQNLLSNALKFRGDDPPHVVVTADRDGDDWVFTFRDNGIGIDPDYADRVFVIFQRLHTKAAYPGTGIGLAMVKKIIEYHGGRIWLDTGNPVGAVFRLTLPATLAGAPDGAAAAAGERGGGP